MMLLPPGQLCELFLAALEYFRNALFVSARLFLAVLTGEGSIGVFCKSFGIQLIHYLPE